MESGSYFDIWTVFLYIFVGILGSVFITNFKKPTIVLVTREAKVMKYNRERVYMILFFLLYVFLAVFRKVGYEIGGTDASNYINNFNAILKGGIDRTGNTELEPGFQFLTRFIRYITDDYKAYFFVCYGIIVYGYIRFIRDVCPRGGSYIPFILLMYPFFRGFNTMRTSLAIAFILIGLTYLDKKKWLSLLLIVSSIFIHRMSFLFVLIWPFFYIFKPFLLNCSRKLFFLSTIIGIIVTFVISIILQNYVLVIGLLAETDESYLSYSIGENYLLRYPLFLGPLLLFLFLIIFYKKIQWNQQTLLLRMLFVFDAWVTPPALILGMWRFVEFMYLVRLSLWCIVIHSLIKNKNQSSAIIIKMGFATAFVTWLIIRIYKEWEALSISPYIFDIF